MNDSVAKLRRDLEVAALSGIALAVGKLQQARMLVAGRDAEPIDETLVWLRLSEKCLEDRYRSGLAAAAESAMRAKWNERIAAETGKANG